MRWAKFYLCSLLLGFTSCTFDLSRSWPDSSLLDSGAQPDAVRPDLTVPTCSDNIQNQNETDLNCGGPACPPCSNLQSCKEARDCQSGFCVGNLCTGAPSMGVLTASVDTLTLPDESCISEPITFTLTGGNIAPDKLRLVKVGRVVVSPPQEFAGTWSGSGPWTFAHALNLCWNSVKGYVQPGDENTPYSFQSISTAASLASSAAMVTIKPGTLRIQATPDVLTLAADSNVGQVTFTVMGAPVDESIGLVDDTGPLGCVPGGNGDCVWRDNHYLYRTECSGVGPHAVMATDIYGRTSQVSFEIKANASWTFTMIEPSSFTIPNNSDDEKDMVHTLRLMGASPYRNSLQSPSGPGPGLYEVDPDNQLIDLNGTWSSSACNEYTFPRRLHGALQSGPVTIRGFTSSGLAKDVALTYKHNPLPRLYVRDSEGTQAPISAPSGAQEWPEHVITIKDEPSFRYIEFQYFGEMVKQNTYPEVIRVCNELPNCTPLEVTPDSLADHCTGDFWPPGGMALPDQEKWYCAWGTNSGNTFTIGRWETSSETNPGKYVTRYTDITGQSATITFIYKN
jgi:hypothetical protein